jgi:probable O-glycosylation ligase (exosortase A-associated)
MRDYLIVAIIVGGAPFCLFYPYWGVLFWAWISYFNPHRYGYSFAYNFPVATIIAVPTLVGTFFTNRANRQRHLFTREMILLLMLWIWFGVTLVYAMNVPQFAGHIDDAQAQMVAVSKILLMTFVTVLLVNTRDRLRNLIIVVALSFGVRALFGALFGFSTGGNFKVYGPPDTFIGDNNDFALALNIVLGMMFYLARSESRRWLRLLFWATFASCIICVLLSYSRGGLLGLAAAAVLMAVRSKKKVLASIFLVVAAMMALNLMTEQWKDRMGNLAEGNLDDSARQRLVSWGFAIHLMEDYPVTGGGFMTFPDVQVFQRYARAELPGGFQSTGPHSIYFQMLGEQGIVGLSLFLCLSLCMILTLRRVRRRARLRPSAQWGLPYANMLETGLAAYLVSGAFLGRAYFDLFYQLVALTAILDILSREEVTPANQMGEDSISRLEMLEGEGVPAEEFG